MSVLLDTSVGEIVIDLYVDKAPLSCTNFLKLCKIKYYNYAPIETVQKNFITEVNGRPGSSGGGESIWGLVEGPEKRFFVPEICERLKHNRKGMVSFAAQKSGADGIPAAGSRFFVTLSDSHLEYLDGRHSIFGRVAEGLDVLDKLNATICSMEGRPYKDLRIKHTYVLDDPFEDIAGMCVPSRSPSPEGEMLKTMRLKEEEAAEEPPADQEAQEELRRRKDAESRKLTLEMVGDLPFAEIKPPENVLFVCKLNSVTNDEDLETIFSRFGKILSCEIVRDRKSGDSLCYAFIEFEDKRACEEAYFKMENVLIDGNRIRVDFSQSVSKLHLSFLERKYALSSPRKRSRGPHAEHTHRSRARSSPVPRQRETNHHRGRHHAPAERRLPRNDQRDRTRRGSRSPPRTKRKP